MRAMLMRGRGQAYGPCVALSLALLTALPRASANEEVTAARQLYEAAEFEAALETLERAEAGDGLGRADLVSALRLRLLLHVAAGATDRLTEDLARLLSLDPATTLDEEYPPDVIAELEQLRETVSEPVSVQAETTPVDAGTRVTAEVRDDPAGLAREVRVFARVDLGETVNGVSELLVPSTSDGQRLFYWATVIGPGGAELAADGSAASPLVQALALTEDEEAVADGDDTLWIVGGAVGGAVLVGTAIILGVVLGTQSQSSDETRPTLPQFVME